MNPFNDEYNRKIFDRFLNDIQWEKFNKSFIKKVSDEIIDNVNTHIEQFKPGLLDNFNALYVEITSLVKKSEETLWQIEKKGKKVFESEALCEDVYKIKDDLKKLKSEVAKYNKNIKKIFS